MGFATCWVMMETASGCQGRVDRYGAFVLVLMVNHQCNLRCTYCYTGAKFSRPMSKAVARAAIDRAVASLRPGGRLELGFFGGEPLLEADLIASLLAYARMLAADRQLELFCSLTTNGTCLGPSAWDVMTNQGIDLSISHDGLPATHDRHRVTPGAEGTSAVVSETLRRLADLGRDFNVVTVVRPDTVDVLAEGVRYLRELGVRRVEPSLDLWTPWSNDAISRLETAVAECADLWREGLPEYSLGWFDEKLVLISGVPTEASARCGFGDGQIAVAPSGSLYPCERVIGEDKPEHPLRLVGTVLRGSDFLSYRRSCSSPPSSCSLECRCSNYVRTGIPSTPDDLLRSFDRMCMKETCRVLEMSPR